MNVGVGCAYVCAFRSSTINKPSGLDFGNCCGWGVGDLVMQMQVQVQQYVDDTAGGVEGCRVKE